LKNMDWPITDYFANEIHYIIFCAQVFAYSSSYVDEESKRF